MEPSYVICKANVEDGEGIYNVAGNRYEIHEIREDSYLIEVEPWPMNDVDDIEIPHDDPDFLVVYEEGDE